MALSEFGSSMRLGLEIAGLLMSAAIDSDGVLLGFVRLMCLRQEPKGLHRVLAPWLTAFCILPCGHLGIAVILSVAALLWQGHEDKCGGRARNSLLSTSMVCSLCALTKAVTLGDVYANLQAASQAEKFMFGVPNEEQVVIQRSA